MEFVCAFGLHHQTHYLAQVILLALSGINYLKPFGLALTKACHFGYAFNLWLVPYWPCL